RSLPMAADKTAKAWIKLSRYLWSLVPGRDPNSKSAQEDWAQQSLKATFEDLDNACHDLSYGEQEGWWPFPKMLSAKQAREYLSAIDEAKQNLDAIAAKLSEIAEKADDAAKGAA